MALKEIADKKPLLAALREMAGRPLGRLLVSTPPPARDKALLPDTHPRARLVMCLQGEYRFKYYDQGVKEAALPPDGLLLTLPGGYLVSGGDKAYLGAQVIFWDKFTRYLLVEGFDTQWHHTANPFPPHGQRVVQGLCSLPLDGEFDAARAKLAEALLRLALIELERDNSERKGKAHGTYRAAQEFMAANLHQELGRARIARACGVTPPRLSKLFRQFESREFNKALKEMRCERAAALLRDSGMTVEEVASLCGFKTAAHFIRVFKIHAGMTPGRFRG